MSNNLELHVRVSSTLMKGDVLLPERHAFPDLSGQIAFAVCTTHTALTKELDPDDPAIDLCPLCAVFLMADEFDADHWKSV